MSIGKLKQRQVIEIYTHSYSSLNRTKHHKARLEAHQRYRTIGRRGHRQMHEQPAEDRRHSRGCDFSRRSEQLAFSTPNKEIDLDGGRLALMSRPSRWPKEIRAEARTATQGMGVVVWRSTRGQGGGGDRKVCCQGFQLCAFIPMWVHRNPFQAASKVVVAQAPGQLLILDEVIISVSV